MFELLLLAAVGAIFVFGQRQAQVSTATPAPGTPAAGTEPAGAEVAPSTTTEAAPPPPPPDFEVRANGVIAPAADPARYAILADETAPPDTPAEQAFHDEIAALVRTDPDAANFVRYSDDPQ